MANASEQVFFTDPTKWKLEVDTTWDLLGPFPIHAREQHFISPAFPLNLSQPIDYDQGWESSYTDGGMVKWSHTTATSEGDIQVSFPHIRWKNLRATEGWAALQHHAVLRTTLKLYPPSNLKHANSPRLLVDLKQGSYFTLRPKGDNSDFIPRWFVGNIYDLERALPHALELPVTPSLTQPTEYDLFVSGDYEIRLFGDPLVRHSEVPVQKLSLRIQVQDSHSSLLHHRSQDITCDFLNGYSFGDVLGVGIQSLEGWWTVQDVVSKTFMTGINVGLRVKSLTIAPLQTRVIPIFLTQTLPFRDEGIDLEILLTSENLSETISLTIPITHHKSMLSASDGQVLKGTYLFADCMPSTFLAIPPLSEALDPRPPILALHGAGVDILSQDFWMKSLPRNKESWIIAPTGRTSWGLDWHGPSVIDAWASVEELATIVQNALYDMPPSWKIPHNAQVVVIGHSNGGQGTWHMAGRYPDRVLAAIPAAAYLKSQAYVPLTLARSSHFIDPALRAILESSLTPDDNDLHVSNLVDTPILAIHGGDDENVPVWHSREALSALKSWHPSAAITLKEDPGEGHWYNYVLNAPEVQTFLDDILKSTKKTAKSNSFTLTVANPRECGTLHGWRIDRLRIPGRLARLHVCKINDSTYELELTNVHTFTIPIHNSPLQISIDGKVLRFPTVDENIQMSKVKSGTWQVLEPLTFLKSAPGRIQSILTSPGPIIIVISETFVKQNLSVAQRLAHVLYLYHRIDCDIIPEHVAVHRTLHASWPPGNIVFIGPPSSEFATHVLAKNRTPVRIVDSSVRLATQRLDKPEQAILFSHPHPSGVKPESFLLLILYNNESGLERAIRLFPFRTGVTVPDWVVVGDKMDNFGAGGIEAAGVWGRNWTLSEAMSWPSL